MKSKNLANDIGRYLPVAFFVSILIFALGCENPNRSSNDEENRKPPKVEFLAFSAKWCGVCRAVPKLLEKLREGMPNVQYREIDVDDPENEALVEKYSPLAMPYMFVVIDGKTVKTITGLYPYDDTMKMLSDAIETFNRNPRR